MNLLYWTGCNSRRGNQIILLPELYQTVSHVTKKTSAPARVKTHEKWMVLTDTWEA